MVSSERRAVKQGPSIAEKQNDSLPSFARCFLIKSNAKEEPYP
jgi:hypothetical protein